jgi:DNA mismatch repair protein MutS2
MTELHQRLKDVQALESDLKRQQSDLAAREKELAKEWERRETTKLKELERRTEEVLAKFEDQAQQTIGQIVHGAEQRKAAEQAQRKIAKTKRELREEFETTVLSTQEDARQGELRRPRIEEGVRVRLKGIREPARVRRKLADDRLEVEAGFMKLQVSVDDVIEVLPDAGGGTKLPKNVSFRPAPELAPVHQEINVIGQRAEEALDNVDQFLDRAVMATASRVRIVHGHGMGILKKAISEMLAKHPHVAKYYPAPQQEGGAGATIVELKD